MINEPDKVDLEGIISGYTMEMMFIVARRPHARANTGHTFLIPKGSLHKKKMPQSGVGSMQGSNEDCLSMKGHTQGGDAHTI